MSTATISLSPAAVAEQNAAIAQGLRRHDPGLIENLIDLYRHRLYRYLLYLTGRRELAEDIFQETWVRVLERGSQYTGRARFETWLFTIARNLMIDQARKRSCQSLDELRDPAENERPFEVISEGRTPLEAAQNAELGQSIAAALGTLDPNHREVVLLRFHEELTLEEIAGITRAPLSTVKSRLYRGMAALRPSLEAAGFNLGEKE